MVFTPREPSQIYLGGEPQVYCADCLHYGDARTFPSDTELDMDLDIVHCPNCCGERIFALSQAKKNEIDALFAEE